MDVWRLSLPRGSLWGVFGFGFACRKAVTLSGRTSITPLGEGGGAAVPSITSGCVTATAAFKPPLRASRSRLPPSLHQNYHLLSLLSRSLSPPLFRAIPNVSFRIRELGQQAQKKARCKSAKGDWTMPCLTLSWFANHSFTYLLSKGAVKSRRKVNDPESRILF